jgi:GrpB-like predicted nucleotidyltransferase (UPF0157 family)
MAGSLRQGCDSRTVAIRPSEYAELKRRLAREDADDREAYAEGKATFVRRVLAGRD